jgi:aminoglycoside phosphotransferase (APT) family kinase protein
MSTIGHPLSDLSNLHTPYVFSQHPIRPDQITFNNILYPGLPHRDKTIEWYTKDAGWDPRADIGWGDAFACLRNAVIMQGIAARLARRQASSEKAREYGEQMPAMGQVTWTLVEQEKERWKAGKREGKL